MLKKPEVNEAIAMGVLTAHTTKYLSTVYGMPSNVEDLFSACMLMAEALVTIDLGYSCSSEELEAGVVALASKGNPPPEIAAALGVRATLKEMEHMSPAEKEARLKEMIAAKFASSLVLNP